MALNPNAAPYGSNVYEQPLYDGAAIVVGTPFPPCKAIYNGTAAQDITVTMLSGNSVAFKAMPIGIFEIACTNVTVGVGGNLVALY